MLKSLLVNLVATVATRFGRGLADKLVKGVVDYATTRHDEVRPRRSRHGRGGTHRQNRRSGYGRGHQR